MNIENHADIRQEFIWTTIDGIEWVLKDMHDSHIRNCIGHLKRNKSRMYGYAEDTITIFKNELIYRRKLKILKILK